LSFINIDKVIEKVKSPNTSLNEKREAVKLLGQSGEERSVEALIDLLPDLNLRVDIVHALGNLANAKATKYLLATMFESDNKVKIEIVKALRRIGDTKCTGSLIQLFKVESDEQVKSAVFILITEFGTYDDVSQIIPGCVQDKNPSVQMLALKYIADKTDLRITALVYPLLFSIDEKVRLLSANILWRLDGVNLLKRLNYILIKTEDNPKRLNIIQIFGALGLIQTVEPLIYTLVKDPDRDIKIEAINALRKIGDKRALGAITQVIKLPDEDIKASAIGALSSFPDPRVTTALINILKTPSEKIRSAAMSSLEKLITINDLANLKNYFSVPDPNIKIFLCKMFGKLKFSDNDIESFLSGCLEAEDNRIIEEALQTIGILNLMSLAEKLVRHFKHSDEAIRVASIKVTGMLNVPTCIEPIVDCYNNESSNKVRATIIEVLGKTRNKKYIKTVALAIKDPDSRVRANSIEALELLGDEEIVEMIYPLLEDSNNRVKANAAKTLWKFGGIRMIGVLENMLLKEKDKWQRASAAFALGEIGSLQVIKSLTSALNDQEDCVRGNAVKALGKTRANEVISSIVPLLEDNSERVREDCVRALGNIGSPEVIEPLLKFLRQQNDSKLINLVVSSIIDSVDGRFLLPLTKVLNDELWIIKVTAAKLLAKIGNDSTLPMLNELLSDGNALIRNSAEDAIEAIKRRKPNGESVKSDENSEDETNKE